MTEILPQEVWFADFPFREDETRFRRKIGKLSNDDWDNVTDLYYRYLVSIGEI